MGLNNRSGFGLVYSDYKKIKIKAIKLYGRICSRKDLNYCFEREKAFYSNSNTTSDLKKKKC